MKISMSRRVFAGSALATAGALASPILSMTVAKSARAQQEGSALITPRILGDPDAPVLMIEYASKTCGHCAAFHRDALPQIKSTYIDTGKVKLEYRDFPLNEAAALGSLLARCAPEDRFFALVDMLYAQQRQWANAQQQLITELARLGGFAGMSKPDLEACFQNNALYSAISNQRLIWSEEHNIRATPTVFVNDTRLEGARPFEEYAEAIEAELA